MTKQKFIYIYIEGITKSLMICKINGYSKYNVN